MTVPRVPYKSPSRFVGDDPLPGEGGSGKYESVCGSNKNLFVSFQITLKFDVNLLVLGLGPWYVVLFHSFSPFTSESVLGDVCSKDPCGGSEVT